MRCATDRRDAVRSRNDRHAKRFVEVLRAVVNAGQQVAVQVNQVRCQSNDDVSRASRESGKARCWDTIMHIVNQDCELHLDESAV